MPKYYTSQDREDIVRVGIFLAIFSCIYFVFMYLIFRFGSLAPIFRVILIVAIHSYLLWASIKIRSKLLYAAIAIALVLNIIGIYYIKFLSFFAFAIILISLIYLKYSGDYSAPDEIQEYEPLIYCSQCGKPIGEDEDFCTNCGAKVE
jgi:hypothetical protein